jgi:hypothetical protein
MDIIKGQRSLFIQLVSALILLQLFAILFTIWHQLISESINQLNWGLKLR